MARRLVYSRAIVGARGKTVAIGVVCVSAAAVALVGVNGTEATASTHRKSAARVALRLPVTDRLDLVDGGWLPLLVRSGQTTRIRLRARLAGAGVVARFAHSRTVTLRRGRWKQVSLRLTAAARTTLSQCPAARIVVTAGHRRVSKPLVLDAPACKRFFGPAAVWNQPLAADTALDPSSQAVTKTLLDEVRSGDRSGLPPTINTTAYAPPVYTVPSDQPRVAVHLDRGARSAPALAAALASVPLPPNARSAPGSDSELVVWQPATDTMWEFWRLRRERGRWLTTWGGRLDHVSTGPGYFSEPHPGWGATASSLPLAGGLITPRELARGEIDHALSLGVPRTRADWFSLPAQRTDGASMCPNAVPEGARFRIDPALDIAALDLPPAVATVARAVQRYGAFVRDGSGAVSFYAQSTVSLSGDPYQQLFGGVAPYELLKSFPWDRLQLVRMDLRQEPGTTAPVGILPVLDCP